MQNPRRLDEPHCIVVSFSPYSLQVKCIRTKHSLCIREKIGERIDRGFGSHFSGESFTPSSFRLLLWVRESLWHQAVEWEAERRVTIHLRGKKRETVGAKTRKRYPISRQDCLTAKRNESFSWQKEFHDSLSESFRTTAGKKREAGGMFWMRDNFSMSWLLFSYFLSPSSEQDYELETRTEILLSMFTRSETRDDTKGVLGVWDTYCVGVRAKQISPFCSFHSSLIQHEKDFFVCT